MFHIEDPEMAFASLSFQIQSGLAVREVQWISWAPILDSLCNVSGHCREAIRGRYALLPYLYTLFQQTHEDGSPILRPLW